MATTTHGSRVLPATSSSGANRFIIKIAQVVWILEFVVFSVTALSILIFFPVKAFGVARQVVLILEVVAGGSLLYFIIERRPWAFLLGGLINISSLANGLIQTLLKKDFFGALLIFICWGLLTLLQFLAWRETRREALLSGNQ